MDLIKSFCEEVKDLLESANSQEEIFARGQALVRGLAQKPVFLKNLFGRMATDDEFLDSRRLPADPNEVTLFVERSLFSLRLYIWDPAISYPIHAHGSWGIVSCVAGEILEKKFERLDDGTKPGYAKIREACRAVLKPGETTTVLPLNEGIHQMESKTKERSSISLHLYERAVRPGFLECFNIHKDTVYKIMPPNLYSRSYVLKALGSIQGEWPEEILRQASTDRRPYIRYEALRALAQVDKCSALKLLEEEAARESSLKKDFASLLGSLK